MASGYKESLVVVSLKDLAFKERVRALVMVLERVHQQRITGKGKEAKSYSEKKKERYYKLKKEKHRACLS